MLEQNVVSVDLHIHTQGSHDSNMKPEAAVQEAIVMGIQAIAITNHECLKDVQRAQEHAQMFEGKVLVIPGIESTVRLNGGKHTGHILGIGLDQSRIREIPRFSQLSRAVGLIRDEMGGIVIAAHPRPKKPGATSFNANEIEQNRNYFDAMEVTRGGEINERLIEVSKRLGLPAIGTSDAHKVEHVGRASTNLLIEGDLNAETIIQAVKVGNITALQGGYPNVSFLERLRKKGWDSIS